MSFTIAQFCFRVAFYCSVFQVLIIFTVAIFFQNISQQGGDGFWWLFKAVYWQLKAVCRSLESSLRISEERQRVVEDCLRVNVVSLRVVEGS
jgi:hypothetical protein